ncbi:MAG: hypothetical protein HQL49_05535 [Gammaproteobacteria bacterium]|nr:hypothetical protein [Gammaproteobacteria bacterium]
MTNETSWLVVRIEKGLFAFNLQTVERVDRVTPWIAIPGVAGAILGGRSLMINW